MIQGVVVFLDAEDILVESLESGADRVHGQGVGGEVDELRLIREGKHGSSWIETD